MSDKITYAERRDVVVDTLSKQSISDVLALYNVLEIKYPVTCVGDDGIHAHNLKAIVWKELSRRCDGMIDVLKETPTKPSEK